MAYCLQCGARMEDDAARCSSCGAPAAERDRAPAAEPDREPAAQSIAADPGLTDSVRQLARQGRKIHAIKKYREATGASLKDAKDAVEAWMHTEGIAEESTVGCGTSVLLLLLLGLGIVVGLR